MRGRKGLIKVLSAITLIVISSCGGGGGEGENPPSVGMTNVATMPEVAADSCGNAVVAYLRQTPPPVAKSVLYVNYYNQYSNTWTGAVQISTNGVSKHRVAISDCYDMAIVAWREANGEIYAKVFDFYSGWSSTELMGIGNSVDVAMNDNGSGTVVWTDGSSLNTRLYDSAGWRNSVTISQAPSGGSIDSPVIKSFIFTDLGYFHILWRETGIDNNGNPYNKILYTSGYGNQYAQPISVWTLTGRLTSNYQTLFYIFPVSLDEGWTSNCDEAIGINYIKAEVDIQNNSITITSQAYASIKPDGQTQPVPISNAITTQIQGTTVDSYIEAPFVNLQAISISYDCTAVAVWDQKDISTGKLDVWTNTYDSNQWASPQKIDNLAEYDYSLHGWVDEIPYTRSKLIVFARAGSPTTAQNTGVFATIYDSGSFTTPLKVSGQWMPTILGNPKVSNGMVVWEDYKQGSTTETTIYGRWYTNSQWSDIIQIGD